MQLIPNSRDVEIQELQRQVELLTWCLEHVEEPCSCDDKSKEEEFVNHFHDRSLMIRPQIMERFVCDDIKELNSHLEIPELNEGIQLL